eukprot:TRINITY_DN1747_c0_g2_i2.p1 TRINITY_DN1747_c0_g2~~TRINITY_DN1747_c0_g2_i2.p1  ORF type:complete len:453 (-),score=95.37 TRINITY_DN1747_c0_g2_i2:113-1471(-)
MIMTTSLLHTLSQKTLEVLSAVIDIESLSRSVTGVSESSSMPLSLEVTVRVLILLLPSTLATAIFLYLHYSSTNTPTPTLKPPPLVHPRQPLNLPARTPMSSMESLSEAEERSLDDYVSRRVDERGERGSESGGESERERGRARERGRDSEDEFVFKSVSSSYSPKLSRPPTRSLNNSLAHSSPSSPTTTSPSSSSSHSRSTSLSNTTPSPTTRRHKHHKHARDPSCSVPPPLRVVRIIDRISRYYRDAGPYNSSLPDLTLLLQEELEVDCVLVGVPGMDHSVATAVFCWKGEILEGIEYSLKGSPCELVAGKFLSTEVDKLHYYNGNVSSVFPDDQWLIDKGIITYYGLPVILHSKLKGTATKIGIFVIMHSEPFSRSKHQLIESLSYIVRDRIASSLELEFLQKTVDTTISSLSGEIQKLGVLNSELYHQLSQTQSGQLHSSGECLGESG